MKRIVFILAGLALFLGLLWLRSEQKGALDQMGVSVASEKPTRDSAHSDPSRKRGERWVRTGQRTLTQPAAEVVREKVSEFGRSRRNLALKLAERKGVKVTPEIESFFAAIESGDWNRIKQTFTTINGGDSSTGHTSARTPEVSAMWPAIIDAFGVAEQAHLLPAESLLDYGYAILDSLEPGMVYVGGTDSSRWVPALLNDTEEGEKHIVITQNGLADSSYLDYVRMQFDGSMSTLTDDESKVAFEAYVDDARQRLLHDQQFPDEPKQIRPGEQVTMEDGKVSVGGQVAVMDINERLLLKLLEKNPDLSFAIGESFPLKNTYADAVPLGPLMELRANAAENFTTERASKSVDYWRNVMDSALAHPETSQSSSALKNYSHDAVAAANLLAAHEFHAEAEETYQLARKFWPENPETVFSLAELYNKTGRADEARALKEQFAREYPEKQKAQPVETSVTFSKKED